MGYLIFSIRRNQQRNTKMQKRYKRSLAVKFYVALIIWFVLQTNVHPLAPVNHTTKYDYMYREEDDLDIIFECKWGLCYPKKSTDVPLCPQDGNDDWVPISRATQYYPDNSKNQNMSCEDNERMVCCVRINKV